MGEDITGVANRYLQPAEWAVSSQWAAFGHWDSGPFLSILMNGSPAGFSQRPYLYSGGTPYLYSGGEDHSRLRAGLSNSDLWKGSLAGLSSSAVSPIYGL